MTSVSAPLPVNRPIVVIGGALGEISVHTSEIPHRGSHVWATPAGQEAYTLGGSAFNVLRHVAAHLTGEQTRQMLFPMISVGRGQWGQRIDAELRSLGLTSLLPTSATDNGWCLTMITPDKERTFITTKGCETLWDEELLNDVTVPENAVVYVSGFQLLAPGQALMRWCARLDDGVTLVVDPGAVAGRLTMHEDWPALLERIDVLTCNEQEAGQILQGCHEQSAWDFVHRYRCVMIRRHGARGASVSVPGCQDDEHVPAPSVVAVDTTGAGDAHCASLLVGLAGESLGDVGADWDGYCEGWRCLLGHANTYAARVVTRVGPM